jgi:hypothetical protein
MCVVGVSFSLSLHASIAMLITPESRRPWSLGGSMSQEATGVATDIRSSTSEAISTKFSLSGLKARVFSLPRFSVFYSILSIETNTKLLLSLVEILAELLLTKSVLNSNQSVQMTASSG